MAGRVGVFVKSLHIDIDNIRILPASVLIEWSLSKVWSQQLTAGMNSDNVSHTKHDMMTLD